LRYTGAPPGAAEDFTLSATVNVDNDAGQSGRRLCCRVLLTLAGLLPGLAGAVEEAEIHWGQRHYGSLDGLPVSSASSAQIDTDGFVWFATHDGLARFDGQQFQVYESMRFPAMSGNRVLSLHLDPQQRMYALTGNGDWLSVRSGHVASALPVDEHRQEVRFVDRESLCLTTATALRCPDGTGNFPLRTAFPSGTDPARALPAGSAAVWLTTRAGSVLLQQQERWRTLWQSPDGNAAQRLRAAVVAPDGALWSDASNRLLRVEPGGAAHLWQEPDSPLDIVQLRNDDDGRVWIGAVNGVFAAGAAGIERVFAENVAAASPNGYRSWRAPDQALWIANGGTLWRHAAGQPVAADRAPVLSSTGLIQELTFGADGSVWVATLHDGVHRLSRKRVDLLDEAAGLASGNLYGVTRDRDDTMWLGSLGGGLVSVDRHGRIGRFGRESGLPGDNPWLVQAAPDGVLYVGTYSAGLWQRPAGSSAFSPLPLPEALRGEQVLAIQFDAARRLWLGSTAGAWRRDDRGWTRQWPTTEGRQKINALAIRGDDVWFGGLGGVWRSQGSSAYPVAEAILAQTSVRDLFLAGDGALWISTDGRGLVRVAADDPAGTRAVQLGRAQGLPSNSPHTVREDARGHLWVNSNQGIFRIARSNLQAFLAGSLPRLSPLVLGLSDGLTELEGNGGVQPAAAFDAQGRLWFPSQRGIVRFDPLAIPLRENAPHAVIDGLETDGQTLALEPGGALPVGARNLLVRYGAADLHAGADLRFRYRLLPQVQSWADALNGRTAAFAGLDPGNYRFELLAGNSDGIWADRPTSFEFRVPPRWHETGLFRAAFVASLSALLLLAVRLRLRSLRLRAAELDRQVGERTEELLAQKDRVESTLADLSRAHAELAQTHAQIGERNQQLAEQARRLEAMDRFRSRVLADVSHELRTPVMLVSLPLRELQSQSAALGDAGSRRLQLALTQLDRLSHLVEQLVGLVQAESGQLRLRLQRMDLGAFLIEVADSYQTAARRVGVSLLTVLPAQRSTVFADHDHLVTVLGNLIDNAIKYSPHGSQIRIGLSEDERHARIEVADAGPGFAPALASQLFERFYRAEGPPRNGREGLGIGLALARELVELHGGRIGASSAPGQGATFRVELPLGSAHVALDELALDEPALDETRSSPAALPAATVADGSGRLLLVEDHPDLAAYLAERLGEHLPVTCVGSVEDALHALAQDAGIRLVISDVVLPGQSGLDLCRRLRGGGVAPRPVILISAKAAESDRSAGLDAGAVAYLAKPFRFEALLDAVAAAWPAGALRVSIGSSDTGDTDPLLQLGLACLGDAAFSIAQWADRAHLSERQLRRRVNELTGLSPQIWLREQRLHRVRQLIRSGECRTLAEAGSRCGLDNPAYLYRSYRARFGDH
jgi:signal transduction histidine kinase/DNA-binding response OmpR family regulator